MSFHFQMVDNHVTKLLDVAPLFVKRRSLIFISFQLGKEKPEMKTLFHFARIFAFNQKQICKKEATKDGRKEAKEIFKYSY